MTRKRPTRTPDSLNGLHDHVDLLMREWAIERPDLDVTPIAVVYRLTRLAAEWNMKIETVFSRAGMTSTDFAVLANLSRAGSPFQLTQRQIMTALRLTSGTISLRVDKLADRGLVERRADPSDARATLVTLTEAGRRTFDAVAPEHIANEARLVAALSADEQSTLGQLLRVMLIEIEQPLAPRPDHALGMIVVSASEGQQRRAAVGMASIPGLLVETVQADGPAARAGLRAGDFITASADIPLRSLICLERALATHHDRLPLTVQRNVRRIELTVVTGLP